MFDSISGRNNAIAKKKKYNKTIQTNMTYSDNKNLYKITGIVLGNVLERVKINVPTWHILCQDFMNVVFTPISVHPEELETQCTSKYMLDLN